MRTKVPYGQTFTLNQTIVGVECWNKTDGSKYDLQAGLKIQLNSAYNSTSTTCCAMDDTGKSLELFPGCYRFIIDNQVLGAAICVPMPKTTPDLIGDIIAYESGVSTPKQQKRLFKTLRKTGIGSRLQGHYSSRM